MKIKLNIPQTAFLQKLLKGYIDNGGNWYEAEQDKLIAKDILNKLDK